MKHDWNYCTIYNLKVKLVTDSCASDYVWAEARTIIEERWRKNNGTSYGAIKKDYRKVGNRKGQTRALEWMSHEMWAFGTNYKKKDGFLWPWVQKPWVWPLGIVPGKRRRRQSRVQYINNIKKWTPPFGRYRTDCKWQESVVKNVMWIGRLPSWLVTWTKVK